ncbi:MAG TPA: hypothetical protein VFC78_15380 [Tepidisphaeraceae bacterium]|nr:hypothetical protein [Tepidisphaeraceae bacterium]
MTAIIEQPKAQAAPDPIVLTGTEIQIVAELCTAGAEISCNTDGIFEIDCPPQTRDGVIEVLERNKTREQEFPHGN